MSAPHRQCSPQLVLAADRKDEEWLLGLDRKGWIGRGHSVPQAREDSKLAKQVEEPVFQHRGVRRNRPVRFADGAVSQEVALQEDELEIVGKVEHHIGQALLMRLAAEPPGPKETCGHHAVEIEFDAKTVGVVIRSRLLPENFPDDLAELLEERLVFAPKVQADLVLAQAALCDVPAE